MKDTVVSNSSQSFNVWEPGRVTAKSTGCKSKIFPSVFIFFWLGGCMKGKRRLVLELHLKSQRENGAITIWSKCKMIDIFTKVFKRPTRVFQVT